jgi:hypothetical protein
MATATAYTPFHANTFATWDGVTTIATSKRIQIAGLTRSGERPAAYMD